MLKIAIGFVHMLIIMKTSVLSCALLISELCVVLWSFQASKCMQRTSKLEIYTVRWKVVTGGHFKVHSYLSLVSDFQLHSNFLMAVSISFKVKTTSKLAITETTTPP